MNKKMTLLGGLLASVLTLGAVGMANAADWEPTKPIELFAPAGPAGGWDLLARAMQKSLTEEKLVDQPVLVTNKPGGGGASGWSYLKGKSGQGEFLAMTSALVLQNNILGKSELTYKDFFPLAYLMTEWEVVAVKADAPWKDGKEFFEALKKDPGKMHIGVGPALGNNDHIQFLALTKRYGADPKSVKFVVYPNTAAEQIPALLGDHIKAITISLGEVMEQVKIGKIRLLGISADKRVSAVSYSPTWKEQGVDFIYPHWRGVIAAPGLSPEQKKFWDDTMAKMVKSATWKKAMQNLEWEEFYQNSTEHTKFLQDMDTEMQGSHKTVGLIK